MIGRTLQDRYRIDAQVGSWCGTEVYRAMDLQYRRPVLVRVLPPALADDESLWPRLVARAERVVNVVHPGVLRLLSLERDQEIAFLVHEYVSASPLGPTWQPGAGPAEPAQVLAYIRQLAEALDALHQAGVSHGALCPACILVDDNTGALLLDAMAVATLQGADQATRAMVALYAAPEQVNPQDLSPAADRYALAALAFQWLTGKDVHAAREDTGLPYERQAALAPPSATRLNPSLPRAVDRAFAVLLHPEAARRPQSATAVAMRLADALRQPPRAARPRWLWGVVGGIVALLLVVGGVWAASRRGSAGPQTTATAQPALTASATAVAPTATQEPLPTDTSLPTESPSPELASATKQPSVAPTTTRTATRRPTTPVTMVPTTPPAPIPTTGSASTLTCSTTVTGIFADLWYTYRDALGCPLEAEPIDGLWAEQPFEYGHMYWSEDADLFLVTIGADDSTGGRWQMFPDDETAWQEGMPNKTCDLEEPSGLDLPERGFGYIWCNNDALRANIGWGTDTERGFGDGVVLFQRFEHGYILRDSDGNTNGLAYVLSSKTGTYVRVPY
ncbi:MAG: serine/threonine-protein kinase [Anaerolineales bacterium]